MEKMNQDIDIQKMFFFPICNRKETDRVFNVKNGKDYLLKLRAETIVDHMRLFRVYRNKALINSAKWSLESSFDKVHYQKFLRQLPIDIRRKCSKVTFGNMFSNDPNGMIYKTAYGPLITISDCTDIVIPRHPVCTDIVIPRHPVQ